jgi:hypothetical protein
VSNIEQAAIPLPVIIRSGRSEAALDCFIRNEYITLYQKLLAESELDPRDEDRHMMLLRLFTEEKAKDEQKESGAVKYLPTA